MDDFEYMREIIVNILKKMKQTDYENWIRTQGNSKLSEEQWEWLIEEITKYMSKQNKIKDGGKNDD